MKRLLAVLATLLSLLSAPVRAQDSVDVANAQAAADRWLALTDTGKYQQSWSQASSMFQAAVTQAQWQSAMQAVRVPLGVVHERAVKSASYTRQLPGAPDGEYVVIQYGSSFGNKASAVETVTPHREVDGTWKVSGYFIK